ncbi:hypothetical protein B0A50_00703 [Salinomyces thailandicus]|uniref:Uncharacterized protein n=1 Tax=Salinomyces thailandicus TaxID=706561 RepID=A0A4U0UCE6_9PEZI|nr:hypothetical protein B0A50_00703 [Salinomyces thailandica]
MQHGGGNDMDLSDDGGVDLELSPKHASSFDMAVDNDNVEPAPGYLPIRDFCQDPNIFTVPGAQLWQLPEDRSEEARRLIAELGDTAQAHIYSKSCRLILKNWGCDPRDALPESLKASTPYSLILLLQLRMLSSYSKKDRQGAHAVLEEQHRARLNALGYSTEVHAVEPVTAHGHNGSNVRGLVFCELSIQENTYGITLEDVAKAVSRVKQLSKEAKAKDPKEIAKKLLRIENRKEKRMQKNESREYRLATDNAPWHAAGTRFTRRKREKERRGTHQQAISRGQSFTNSQPVDQYNMRRGVKLELPTLEEVRAQRAAETTQMGGGMTINGFGFDDRFYDGFDDRFHDGFDDDVKPTISSDGFAEDVKPAINNRRQDYSRDNMVDEAVYATLSDADRRDFRDITAMLNSTLRVEHTLEAQSETGPGLPAVEGNTDDPQQRNKENENKKVPRKVQRLQAFSEMGGRSRRTFGVKGATMPSERFDFGSLATLQTEEEREVMESMRTMELAEMGQKELPGA